MSHFHLHFGGLSIEKVASGYPSTTVANFTIYIYIYIYIYRQYFFVNTYFIKQYRHPLSTHFCIYPFESPHRFYGIRLELVHEPPIINWFPRTFCPILGHHQWGVYCKSDLIFGGFFWFCWVLWHINFCRLFNAKSIFM